jgi:ribosomal protein L7/L12
MVTACKAAVARNKCAATIAAALGAALVALALPARADSPDRPLNFAPRLVAAINGKNLERRIALLHPKSLACLTPQTRPLMEDSLARQLRHSIPADHQSRVETVAGDFLLAVADGVEFPLRPTHAVHIDWETAPFKSVTVIALVAYAEGRWREVVPCIKPEKVPQLQAAKDARQKQAERVKSLAANMSPALRANVSRLVAQGRKIDAIKEYQNATGEDLSTAKSVVELVSAN